MTVTTPPDALALMPRLLPITELIWLARFVATVLGDALAVALYVAVSCPTGVVPVSDASYAVTENVSDALVVPLT